MANSASRSARSPSAIVPHLITQLSPLKASRNEPTGKAAREIVGLLLCAECQRLCDQCDSRWGDMITPVIARLMRAGGTNDVVIVSRRHRAKICGRRKVQTQIATRWGVVCNTGLIARARTIRIGTHPEQIGRFLPMLCPRHYSVFVGRSCDSMRQR